MFRAHFAGSACDLNLTINSFPRKELLIGKKKPTTALPVSGAVSGAEQPFSRASILQNHVSRSRQTFVAT
jgi:hypothetical protein